jgi:hypothetical protein
MGSDGPSRRVQKCSVQASRTANITLPSGTMQRQTCTRSGVATAMASSALKVLLRVGLDVPVAGRTDGAGTGEDEREVDAVHGTDEDERAIRLVLRIGWCDQRTLSSSGR